MWIAKALLKPRQLRVWSAGGTAETKGVKDVECWCTAETKGVEGADTKGVEGVKYWVSSLFELAVIA